MISSKSGRLTLSIPSPHRVINYIVRNFQLISFVAVLFCLAASTEASMLAGLGELFFLKLFTYGRESMAVGLGSIGIDKNCSI